MNSLMKSNQLFRVSRFGLALLLLATGTNGLVVLVGYPPLFPYKSVPFMVYLIETKFLLPAKLIETTAGLLLLVNRWPRLALFMEVPVACNIVWFHWLFDRTNWPIAGLLMTLLLLTSWPHRQAIRVLFEQ